MIYRLKRIMSNFPCPTCGAVYSTASGAQSCYASH